MMQQNTLEVERNVTSIMAEIAEFVVTFN